MSAPDLVGRDFARRRVGSTPATILEVRRILYEHLGIACGLECEVPDRIDRLMQEEGARYRSAWHAAARHGSGRP